MPMVEITNRSRGSFGVHNSAGKLVTIEGRSSAKVDVHDKVAAKLEAMAAHPQATIRLGGKPLRAKPIERAKLTA